MSIGPFVSKKKVYGPATQPRSAEGRLQANSEPADKNDSQAWPDGGWFPQRKISQALRTERSL